MKISFVVYGTPQPQGSTRAFMPKGARFPVTTSDNPKLKPWRQQVFGSAIDAIKENGGEIIPREIPVVVRMDFYLAKPPSKPKRVTRPTTRPDVSKLLRAVEDSLTGTIIEDDSQICDAIVSKNYGSPERVEITVATSTEAVALVEQARARTLELFT